MFVLSTMLFLSHQRLPKAPILAAVIYVAMHQLTWGASGTQGTAPPTVPVLSVTSDSNRISAGPEVCRQTILTAQQMAQRNEDNKTWFQKNWLPTLAGIAGVAVGIQLSSHVSSAAAGALILPTILLPGAAAFMLTQMLIPADPLLATPKPGSYVAEQRFYFDTVCEPGPPIYTQSPYYRVTYRFNGQMQSALVKYDPGERLAITPQGRPVNEISPSAVKTK